MKYVAPVAELVSVEAVNVLLISPQCTCEVSDCQYEIDGCPDDWN